MQNDGSTDGQGRLTKPFQKRMAMVGIIENAVAKLTDALSHAENILAAGLVDDDRGTDAEYVRHYIGCARDFLELWNRP